MNAVQIHAVNHAIRRYLQTIPEAQICGLYYSQVLQVVSILNRYTCQNKHEYLPKMN